MIKKVAVIGAGWGRNKKKIIGSRKMKTYIIWLTGVILWNFGVPDASPIEDVVVAMLLSVLVIWLNKIFKKELF